MIIRAEDMPAPRLELSWRQTDGPNNWHCDYFLVLQLGVHDIRVKDEEHELRIPIGGGTKAQRGKPPDYFDGEIDTPFREGAHAKWDAEQLGGLPVYAVYNGRACRIESQSRRNDVP